ncbi:glycosyltransferase family 4 protein [Halomonas maura]|uniref:glycosyltransferase family 4 protein n=1 Tax=Halomonas maura TaxID=117606 RepID=UPI0025B56B42|nr:glycosyltransferase family 4 protein [Halomonas maura]MDN3555225.1 glycosyltransferase family 4 protein [Halomonas maura]
MSTCDPQPARRLVILNQAANYLAVGFANAFNKKFDSVTLISGSVHVQGEQLDSNINVHYINQWYERPARKKVASYILAMLRMWWLLITRYRNHEVLFISVPPMAYLLNLVLPHRFSMIIWDVYPDTFKVTGMKESHPLYRLWSRLNRRSFRKAYRLFTISEVMADALSKYVNRDRLIILPIWSIFQNEERIPPHRNIFLEKYNINDYFIVQYSGNIGLTHNVELLIEIADRFRDNDRILFQIIGRGPRELVIRRNVEERGLSNVQMLPFQSDEMFPHSLSAADIGVVMLNEHVSQGSVPSKAYNLMSFGIPSLYVAAKDSQLAHYAEKFEHARCFESSQLADIEKFIIELASHPRRKHAMSELSRLAASHFTRGNADRFVQSYFTQRSSLL